MAFWDLDSSQASFTAVKSAEGSLAYGELANLADAASSALNRSEVILFLATNAVGSIAVYLGALRAGAVPLLVSEHVALGTMADIDAAYLPELAWLPEGHPLARGRRVLWSHGGSCLIRLRDSQGVVHPQLALLLPTSGSTGSPRYVRATFGNLQSNAESIATYMGLRSDDVGVTSLPFSYSYGVSVVNSFLEAGASLAVTSGSLMERSFWDFMRDAGVTMLPGVPYTYRMLARLRFERMNLPELRMLTQAGGRLGEQLHEKFAAVAAEKGLRFFAMYGQTEATARIAYLPPDRALEKIGSVGIPIPGGTIRLETEGYPDVPVGEEGELVYEGPNVTMGYAECRADLFRGDDFDGVLRTGDIAVRDADGFLYIRGRKSRFLKVFGNRVSLDDLERALAARGFSAACAGEDDRVEVYVEGDDAQRVKDGLADLATLPASAFRVISVDALPRSDAGKILYAQLKEAQ